MASGGHSHIVDGQDYTHYHILGHTVDDAAGEAFDKVARTLGLPYPCLLYTSLYCSRELALKSRSIYV